MTIIFNSGDEPVTVDDLLLSEIEEHFQQTEEGLFLEKVVPPLEESLCSLLFCFDS